MNWEPNTTFEGENVTIGGWSVYVFRYKNRAHFRYTLALAGSRDDFAETDTPHTTLEDAKAHAIEWAASVLECEAKKLRTDGTR